MKKSDFRTLLVECFRETLQEINYSQKLDSKIKSKLIDQLEDFGTSLDAEGGIPNTSKIWTAFDRLLVLLKKA